MRWVIMDLDGTLVDLGVNWSLVKEKVQGYFSAAGLEINPTPLLPKIEEALLKTSGKKTNRESVQKILTEGEERSLTDFKVIPGAKNLLAGLKEKNYGIVVFTSNDQEIAEKVLKKSGLEATRVVGRTLGEPSKPDYRALERLRKTFNDTENVTAVIGDSWTDEKVSDFFMVPLFKVDRYTLESKFQEILKKL